MNKLPRSSRLLYIVLFLFVFSMFGIYVVSAYSRRTSFRSEAGSCTLPTLIDSQIVLTPTSSDNVMDCSLEDITIASGGSLIIESYIDSNGEVEDDYGMELLFRNLTIESGGYISASGYGYESGSLDGVGNGEASLGGSGGSGGGYGGAGGEGESDGVEPSGSAGSSYGIDYNPIYLGGAGGDSGDGGLGGRGGGAVKIVVSENLGLDGIVESDGLDGELGGVFPDESSGGGGSGGVDIYNSGEFFRCG